MIYYKVKFKYDFTEELDKRTQKRVWEDISTDIRFSDTQNNLSGYKLFVYDNDETAFYAVLMFSIKSLMKLLQ